MSCIVEFEKKSLKASKVQREKAVVNILGLQSLKRSR